MVGLAKSRLLEAARLGTARVVGRRGRRGAAALVDAAEAVDRGFVAESARSPERVFLPGRKDPVVLRQNSAELFLLARLRDEAHRFAIAFHRKLRRTRNFQSVLEEIPGVGAGRRRTLLRHFGSLKRVKEATVEELAAVEGFGPGQAAKVHAFFHAAGAEAPAEEAVDEARIDAALAEEDAEGGSTSAPPGAA
jgi:excinuclease ABC subunit C